MAKQTFHITKDNIKAELLDGFTAKGYTVVERTYDNTWDITKDGCKTHVDLMTNRYGEYYCTVGYANRKLKNPLTIKKALDKEISEQAERVARDKVGRNNLETARRVLEAKGFNENQYSLSGYDSYASVSFNFVTLKDNSDFTWGGQNKVTLRLQPSGVMIESYNLKELDIELLTLVKEKVAEIQDAWEISIL